MGKRYPGKNEGAEPAQKYTVQYGENDLSRHSLVLGCQSVKRGEVVQEIWRTEGTREGTEREAALQTEYGRHAWYTHTGADCGANRVQ